MNLLEKVNNIISRKQFNREFSSYNQLNINPLISQFKGCSAKMITIVGDGIYFSKTKTYLIIWINKQTPCYAWVDESQVSSTKFIKEENGFYIGNEMQEINSDFNELDIEDIVFRALKENMEVY